MSQTQGHLNPEQRAAVTHGQGPLMVLAGAGSGKTRVLVARIAHLCQEGVDARAILAVTFTNKAAGEMRDRLAHLLGGRASGMWIGTFHATCARILRLYADRVGLTRDFTIFDDDDQKRLVGGILKDLGVAGEVPPRAILSRIDHAKNAGEDPLLRQAKDYVDDLVKKVFPEYQARLAREDAVDFNDLLLRVLDLCVDREVGTLLQGLFSHVLVDEFQDTNLVQYRLVKHLSQKSGNLCVVGDDDQSIYRWRGAEPKNLLHFDRDFPDAHVIKLEQNYRSTSTILRCANALIAKNVVRHPKALWTERGVGEPVLLEECFDERGEAEFVAQAIAGLCASEGRGVGDMAVLYRTHAQSRVLEEALRARRLPYRIVGGVSFFQRREIKDITEYLRLCQNPQADSAFERVINVPTRGIGDTTMDRIRAHARVAGLSLLEATRSSAAGAVPDIGAAARRRLEGFLELYDGLRAVLSAGATVAELVDQTIQRTGYADRLEIEDKVDGPDRLRNLRELVAAAAAFDADLGAQATLAAFNERIALTSATDDKDGRGEAVTLTTIHAAKGLEFPVVFLVGLEETIFPSIRDEDRDEQLEEERRLAYVATTRARDRLILSYARQRRTYDEVRRNAPSRFLSDLPPEAVAVRARAQARRAETPRREARRDDDYDQRTGQEEPVYYVDDAGEDDPTFPRGAKVRHKIFGVGQIEDGSGRGPDRKLTIQFPGHGRKTIVARFVERV